jgi:deoxyribonuclease-4
MNIGAHVSASGGLDKTIDRGTALGATAIQSFASSPRSIKYTPYTKDVIEIYNHKRSLSHIKTHVFHGVYLINLAHQNPEYVEACINSLIYYQQLAKDIKGLGTVFHLGSHKGKGLEYFFDQVVSAIVTILEKSPQGVKLILENAAGQNGVIGQNTNELAQIFDAVSHQTARVDNLGVCIDSQHAFASGYALHTPSGLDSLIADVDASIGLDKLYLIHLNDSLVEFASHKDRHANLGEGVMGMSSFSHILHHPRLSSLPFILEVPGEKRSGPRKSDVDQLKSL